MTYVPTNAEKMRRLPWSIGSDAANAVFAQLTYFGSIFVLFLSALSFNKTQIGFLLSLIPFSGLIALFIASAVARFGYKRTYIIFHGARKVVTILLLGTPWILAQFGAQATLFYIAGVVATFSIVRAIAITAIYPWTQEYVPSAVRGKYSAIDNI